MRMDARDMGAATRQRWQPGEKAMQSQRTSTHSRMPRRMTTMIGAVAMLSALAIAMVVVFVLLFVPIPMRPTL